MKRTPLPSEEIDDFAEDSSNEGRIRDLLSMLLRGKWTILAALALGIGSMAWYTSSQAPVYEASSLVLINQKSSQAANPFSELMEVGPSSKLANELAILRTRTLSEAVAEKLLAKPYLDESKKQFLPLIQVYSERGPTGELVPLGTAATRALLSMDFIPQRESDVIKIIGYSNNPNEAAILANAYAESYQEQTTLQSRSRTRSVREFLENRLSEQRDSLRNAEKFMKEFMEGAGVVSLDQESERVVAEMSQLEATRNAVDLDIQTAQKKLLSLQNELPQQEAQATAAISQANDSYIRELQEKVGRLEAQRDLMVAQSDPAVLQQEMYQQRLRELDDQINNLRQRLKERSAQFIQSFLAGESVGPQSDALGYLRGLKQQLLETRVQLEILASRRNALDNSVSQYEARFRQIPRKSIEFARLQRDRMGAERLYSLVDERYNQAAITEKSEFGYVDIIDRATVPLRPVSPDLRKNLLIGLLAGLSAGLGLVFLQNKADVRVRTPEQMARAGYRPLAEVAPMGKELKDLRRGGRTPKEARRIDASLWLVFDPMSMIAESFRRLRTTLLRMQVEQPVKVVLFTSPSPSEGKTTVACNLALTLAETRKRVLLLDADIRKPRIHTMFGVGNKPGLTDLVGGRATIEQVIQREVMESLDFISCGTMMSQPSRVFSSDEMFSLLELVKLRYDFMIIDAPPALVVNDAAVLAGVVDGVIIVTSTGRTRLAAVTKTRQVLEAARGRIIGIVLNNFDPLREYGRYYGGYRYGHYGSYRGYHGSGGEADKGKQKKAQGLG